MVFQILPFKSGKASLQKKKKKMMITAYVRYSLKYEHNAREMHVAKAKNKKTKNKEKKKERVTIIFCNKAELTQ